MDVLYSGFDGLDVTYQGAVSGGLLVKLKAAKLQAQEEKRPVVYIEHGGQSLGVARAGAPGFAYKVDTGPDGEVWMIADSGRTDAWNIRVSVRSLALATRGYRAQVERLEKLLELFGAVTLDHRVARVDVCADVAAPDFVLDPTRIVAHWRTTNSQYWSGEDHSVVSQGGRVNSVTLGKMPGRQVIIYDKRREVIDRQKSYWWDVWGVDRSVKVWRVEVRAGKDHLRDTWGVRRLDDLEACLQSMVADAMQSVRLLDDEQTDSNVTRQAVHPLWAVVREAFAKLLAWTGEAERAAKVIEGYRDALRERFHRLMGGMLASYTVILGEPPFGRSEEVAQAATDGLTRWMVANPRRFAESWKRARARFRILEADETVMVAA